MDKPLKRSIRPPSRFQNYEMMSSFCFEENLTEKTPLESSKKALQNNSKSAQKEVGFVISENKQNHIQDDIVSKEFFLKKVKFSQESVLCTMDFFMKSISRNIS